MSEYPIFVDQRRKHQENQFTCSILCLCWVLKARENLLFFVHFDLQNLFSLLGLDSVVVVIDVVVFGAIDDVVKDVEGVRVWMLFV